jgi:hypothetical protein
MGRSLAWWCAALVALAAALAPPAGAMRPQYPGDDGNLCLPGPMSVGDGADSLGAAALGVAVVARSAPSASGHIIARVRPVTPEGARTAFLVQLRIVDARCRTRWYRVLLPQRPNGSAGWVAAGALSTYAVSTSIEVDLSRHLLRVMRGVRLVEQMPVAVGTSRTPTPIGHFYVVERVRTTNPAGPYGPGALGLSAFSPVLTSWTQGGPIGIHGTDRPDSIGKDASNGCIRVPNSRVPGLLREVAPGTPVTIHP